MARHIFGKTSLSEVKSKYLFFVKIFVLLCKTCVFCQFFNPNDRSVPQLSFMLQRSLSTSLKCEITRHWNGSTKQGWTIYLVIGKLFMSVFKKCGNAEAVF